MTSPPAFPAQLGAIIARLRRLFETAPDWRDGATGTCRLCGKHRHDLDGNELCEPCSLAVW